MAFPKTPYKPVTGKLTLSIRPPSIEVTVGEEEETPEKQETAKGPDISQHLEFKLPRGFSMGVDPKELTSAQHERVAGQILKIREKRNTCAACRNATSVRMLDLAEESLGFITSGLIEKSLASKIRFSQEKDGALVLYFEVSNRTLGFKILTGAVEVGYFMPNGLSNESKHRITDFYPEKHLSWLTKG